MCKLEEHETKAVKLSMERDSMKQKGYIAGFTNGISTPLLINTGANTSLTSKVIYYKLGDKS